MMLAFVFVFRCGEKRYNLEAMPKTSVIISFHENENLSHLLRTLHSIVKRTPPTLLEEIILINDNSHKGKQQVQQHCAQRLQQQFKTCFFVFAEDHEMILQNYINTVFRSTKIRLLFSHTALGLIKARLSGVRLAKGEVIVSMDSHMEVQERWSVAVYFIYFVNRVFENQVGTST
jgi:polypeptide N-acetylgalactosaminyltransferase